MKKSIIDAGWWDEPQNRRMPSSEKSLYFYLTCGGQGAFCGIYVHFIDEIAFHVGLKEDIVWDILVGGHIPRIFYDHHQHTVLALDRFRLRRLLGGDPRKIDHGILKAHDLTRKSKDLWARWTREYREYVLTRPVIAARLVDQLDRSPLPTQIINKPHRPGVRQRLAEFLGRFDEVNRIAVLGAYEDVTRSSGEDRKRELLQALHQLPNDDIQRACHQWNAERPVGGDRVERLIARIRQMEREPCRQNA